MRGRQKLQRFREFLVEFREFPGTTILVLVWIGVYIGSLIYQGSFSTKLSLNFLMSLGGINTSIGHALGDARAVDFYEHEWWRAVTSSVFHYSLMHIVLNLLGLIQLGRMVESWYGTGPFLIISVLIGGIGNLAAGYVRPMFGGDPTTHCAGGSTLVLGLVGLCAVVGWRSKTRLGKALQAQMVGVLVMTGLLGVAIPVIDNYGHAFGAIVGGCFGLFHRRLVHVRNHWIQLVLGLIAVSILVTCGVLQYRSTMGEIEALNLEFTEALSNIQAIERAQQSYENEARQRTAPSRFFNRGEYIPIPQGYLTAPPNVRIPWKVAVVEALPPLEEACRTLADSPDDPVANKTIELFKAIQDSPADLVGFVAFREASNALRARAAERLDAAKKRQLGR